MLNNDKSNQHCPAFIGTATMGEKGQIVIPKEVREMYNLKKGEQLVVIVGPQDTIALIPMSKAKTMLASITKQLSDIINK